MYHFEMSIGGEMLEIVAPAGSPESVIAAVQNGADAVYLGFSDMNARNPSLDTNAIKV